MRHTNQLVWPRSAVLAVAVLTAACGGGDVAVSESDTTPPTPREDSLAGVITEMRAELVALRGEARALQARLATAEGSPNAGAPRDDSAPTDLEPVSPVSPVPIAPAREASALDAALARVLLRFPGSNGAQITYVGESRDGQAIGVGYAVWSTGSSYEGEWRGNRRHGEGRHRYPDGARYEGLYRDDQREGQGSYFYRNGQRWEGPWRDNLRHGEGVLYEADGRVRVRGIWERDRLVREIKD